MNGTATRPYSRNVTVEDDPEPGDPPPRIPSPSPQPREPSPPQKQSSQESSSPRPISMPASDVENVVSDDEPEYMNPLQYRNSLIRQATMPTLPPDMDDFGIPPSPPGSPDPSLTQKFENFRGLRDQGV